MRAGLMLCFLCVVLTQPSVAAEPKTADQAARMQMEALGDRWPDRWQGRQHYLYDEENLPQTTAAGAADARACANEMMRVRRPDGSTRVQRVNRCR
jgi:hypothetical protein